MLRSMQTFLPVLLLALTVLIVPALWAQAAAPEDNTLRNQLIFGGAAVLILIVYMKRRGKRKKLD